MPYIPVAVVEAGGSGGLSQSYVGYNTVGASFENVTGGRLYAKTVTVAADSLMNSIDLHVKGNGSNVGGVNAIIWADNAGTPAKVIATCFMNDDTLFMDSTAGWVSVPIGKWLTAGTYWIGFVGVANISGDCQIAYDSGADKNATTGGNWAEDTGQTAGWSDSTRKYSIRASVIS